MKNNKVIKALTIGLAAAIAATSNPMNVFADDENTNIENQENSQGSESSSQNDSVSETASDCATIISEENNQITEATEAIGDASDAVGDIITAAGEQEIQVPAETLTNMQQELQQSANEIGQAGGNIEIAVQAFNEALVADLNVESDAKIAHDNLTNMQNSVNDFDSARVVFDEILKYFPNNVDALVSRGICFKRDEKYGEALNCFDKVLELPFCEAGIDQDVPDSS